MINVCAACGAYRADKLVDPTGTGVICPECGHREAFIRSTLSIVSGASGAGKTTVCARLTGTVRTCVILDADILWGPQYADPTSGHRAFFETWLRLCKNIAQSGRPVVLFGAGFGVPANLDACVERRYFGEIRYLALTCTAETLRSRLLERPRWRESGVETFIAEQVRFNDWFVRESRRGSMACIDTSDEPLDAVAARVADWIRAGLAA